MDEQDRKPKGPGKLMSTLGYASIIGAIGIVVGTLVGLAVSKGRAGKEGIKKLLSMETIEFISNNPEAAINVIKPAVIGSGVGSVVGSVAGGVIGYRTAAAGQKQVAELGEENDALQAKVDSLSQQAVLGKHTQQVMDKRSQASEKAVG
jgi:hypothetical protein